MTTVQGFINGRSYSDPDREALCRRVAAAFVEIADAAIAERGRFVAALTGGRTARTLHRVLAHSYKDSSIWGKTHVFWGDERLVPPDHSDSNYGVAYADLVSKVGIPSDHVHRIRGEIESPDESALRYEVMLRDFGLTLPTSGEGNRFDLILLSLGADGHVASLFPGAADSNKADRYVVLACAPAGMAVQHRITLTIPVINAARAVFVMASGIEKAPVVRRLAAGGHDCADIPAALVEPSGELRWFFDQAAAAG